MKNNHEQSFMWFGCFEGGGGEISPPTNTASKFAQYYSAILQHVFNVGASQHVKSGGAGMATRTWTLWSEGEDKKQQREKPVLWAAQAKQTHCGFEICVKISCVALERSHVKGEND